MTTLEKIRAEIQKVLDAEGDSENAKAQALALFWVLELFDKYADQEPTGKWIPVSERLPEDHDLYLIVVKEKSTGYQYIPRVASHLHDNDWCMTDTEDADEDWLNDLRCVAWMPLPEPYKESEDKE